MKASPRGSANTMLPGVHRVKARGRVYYYAWRGGPALPDPGVDPRAFAEAYARHTIGRAAAEKTIYTLILDYRASPEWRRLSDETQRVRNFRLAAIEQKFGKLPLVFIAGAGMRGAIIAWRDAMADRPRAADDHIEALNVLLNWAVDRERIAKNPAKGIARLYSSNRSDVIFTDDELARIAADARPDLRMVVRAAVLTGLRAGDLADLRWRDVDLEDGIIERVTNKSRRDPVRTFMAILPELRGVLAEAAAERVVGPDSRVFLRAGRPWRPKQISDAFDYLVRKLNIDKHFHDLRGNAATALISAGVPPHDVDHWMGWKPGKGAGMKKRYVSRREVARELAEMLAPRRPEA